MPQQMVYRSNCVLVLEGQKLIILGFAVYLFLSFGFSDALAGTFIAFGPQNYSRGQGEPVMVPANFTVSNPNTSYTLQIINGGINDTAGEPVSSSIFTLNGTEIIGPQEFNQNVSLIEKPIAVLLQNNLNVEVRGKPGGTVTVQVLGEDDDPPAIQAQVTPSSNIGGWHNSDVTVSFICQDAISGIASCPAPIFVTADGQGQVISGTATDLASNTASTSVTINLDKTAPAVTITQPTNQATVTQLHLTVEGTVSDALSGIEQVTCDGIPALVNGSTFSCQISFDGLNLFPQITAMATDQAGNTGQSSIQVALDSNGSDKVVAQVNSDGALLTLPNVATLLIPPGSIGGATVELSTPELPVLAEVMAETYPENATLLSSPPLLIKSSVPFTETIRLEYAIPDLMTAVPAGNYPALAALIQEGEEGEEKNTLSSLGGEVCGEKRNALCVTLLPSNFLPINPFDPEDPIIIVVPITLPGTTPINPPFWTWTNDTKQVFDANDGHFPLQGTFTFEAPPGREIRLANPLGVEDLIVVSHMQEARAATNNSQHQGVDLRANEKFVFAPLSGRVAQPFGLGKCTGYRMWIEHFDSFRSGYLHLTPFSIFNPPSLGISVDTGDLIALSGDTYNCTKNGMVKPTVDPHLHFNFWYGNRAIDPMPLLPGGNLGQFQTRPAQTTPPAAEAPTILELWLVPRNVSLQRLPDSQRKLVKPYYKETVRAGTVNFSKTVDLEAQLTQLGISLEDLNFIGFDLELKVCSFRLGGCWTVDKWQVDLFPCTDLYPNFEGRVGVVGLTGESKETPPGGQSSPLHFNITNAYGNAQASASKGELRVSASYNDPFNHLFKSNGSAARAIYTETILITAPDMTGQKGIIEITKHSNVSKTMECIPSDSPYYPGANGSGRLEYNSSAASGFRYCIQNSQYTDYIFSGNDTSSPTKGEYVFTYGTPFPLTFSAQVSGYASHFKPGVITGSITHSFSFQESDIVVLNSPPGGYKVRFCRMPSSP